MCTDFFVAAAVSTTGAVAADASDRPAKPPGVRALWRREAERLVTMSRFEYSFAKFRVPTAAGYGSALIGRQAARSLPLTPGSGRAGPSPRACRPSFSEDAVLTP